MTKPIVVLFLLLLPGFVSAQSDSSSAVKDSLKTHGTFSGQVYFDYFYDVKQKDTTKKDFNGFQIRRVFFTYDRPITEHFDTRFRLEADQISLTSNGKIGVAVKEAYLRWKNVFGQSDLVAGLSPTPTWDFSEHEWNYRSLEKTIMDLQGIASRTDLGIDLKGTLGEEAPVNYWIKIGNNSGNSPEKDNFKRLYGLLHFNPAPQVNFTIYGDYAGGRQVYDDFDGQFKSSDSITVAGFLDYSLKDHYAVGIEAFHRTIENSLPPLVDSTGPFLTKNVNGVSIFGWTSLTEQVRLVARYDFFDPNSSADKDGSSLFIGAIDFMPDPNIHVMPNIYVQSYQADVANDIVLRLTFHYNF